MPRPHRTKPFVIQGSIRSRAPLEAILRRVATPATWPEWQSEIVSTEGPDRVSKGDVVEGRARLLGFDVRGRSAVTAVLPDRLEEDVIVGVRMRIRYRVVPVDGGSVIEHRMHADLPAGVAGRILSWFLAWRLKKMQSELLERLRDQAEGEPF